MRKKIQVAQQNRAVFLFLDSNAKMGFLLPPAAISLRPEYHSRFLLREVNHLVPQSMYCNCVDFEQLAILRRIA